jgi:hypothetical protein
MRVPSGSAEKNFFEIRVIENQKGRALNCERGP